jgi:predicted RNase H-like HicB family nuclease
MDKPKFSQPGDSVEYQYTVYFEPFEEGGYNVIVPPIQEICTCGSKTIEEAREMARDGIRCVIESALKNGEPIPQEVDPAKERVSV